MEYVFIGGSLILVIGLSRMDRKGKLEKRQAASYANAKTGSINEKAQRNRSRMNAEVIPYINIDTTEQVNHGRVALNTENKGIYNEFVNGIEKFEGESQHLAAYFHNKWLDASDSILTGWGDRPSEIINTVDTN